MMIVMIIKVGGLFSQYNSLHYVALSFTTTAMGLLDEKFVWEANGLTPTEHLARFIVVHRILEIATLNKDHHLAYYSEEMGDDEWEDLAVTDELRESILRALERERDIAFEIEEYVSGLSLDEGRMVATGVISFFGEFGELPLEIGRAIEGLVPAIKAYADEPIILSSRPENAIKWKTGRRAQLCHMLRMLADKYELIEQEGIWVGPSQHFVDDSGKPLDLRQEHHSIEQLLANLKSKGSVEPIIWKGTQSLLVYLALRLRDDAGLVTSESLWVEVASTFRSQGGGNYSNDSLRKYASGLSPLDELGTASSKGKPKGYEMVDDVIMTLIG